MGLPLFFDSIGTILVAAIGGMLPGVIVGYVSNLINSINDPITLYYGVLGVIMAMAASRMSSKGYFRKKKGLVIAVIVFAFIGGCAGSAMTWFLYGGGIGEGISAPLAHFINNHGVGQFLSQFTADTLIDLLDKTLNVIIVFLTLKLYPAKYDNTFIYSKIYTKDQSFIEKHTYYRKNSVRTEIVSLIVGASIIISIVSTGISYTFYRSNLQEQYRQAAVNGAMLAAECIDGNRVNRYLENSTKEAGYIPTKNELQKLFKSMDNIKYLYVYKIEEDGCHVVFDFDTEDVKAQQTGDIVDFDPSFSQYLDKLLAGESIETVVSNDSFGWLMTSYIPVKDDNGVTQAYACVDISMEDFVRDMQVYLIKIVAILFGITIILAVFSIWYVMHKFVEPIQSMVEQSLEFENANPVEWLDSDEWRGRNAVESGNELEKLYEVVCSNQVAAVHNVIKARETEVKLLESEELKSKNRELASAVKKVDEANKAKTAFWSNISHDMRTPLNSVIGFTNLAKDSESNEEKNEYLDKIGQSAQYLLGLINDTLDMSKIETGKITLQKEVASEKVIFARVIASITPTIKAKNITLHIENEDMLNGYVNMDVLRFQEILLNILSNAVKFTPEGGDIYMKADCLGHDGNIYHNKVTIRDTGIGMSREFLPKVFEPFAQEKPYENGNYSGSGLGMSIVKQLVEMMGGHIEVESTQGKGTTFTVFIECEHVEAPEKKLDVSASKKVVLNGKKILLCEDHPLNIELARRILEKEGIIVTVAEDGVKEVEKFRNSEPGYFDLIITDIRMPNMDGLQAAKIIRDMDRADARTIPIVAMTANAYDTDRKAAKEAGMNAHLTKPMDPEILYETLTELLQ